MTNEIENIPCIEITQPIGTFFVAPISARTLLKRTQIARRGLTPEEKENVQRRLNKDRTAEIAQYVTRNNATFPTSVIVAANSDFLHYDPANSRLIIGREVVSDTAPLKFEPLCDDDFIGLVIDGQHRIEGLKRASERDNTVLDKYQIPVVFMFDMSLEDMAEVFRTINAKQRPVDPSLIIDLFGLSHKRSPKRTCHTLAIGFNEAEGSPLKDGMKMLGRREKKTEFLSQGSFAKYVLSLISKNPDDDELRLMKPVPDLLPDPKAPLREFFIEGKDELLAKTLWSYFSAAQEIFKNEWDIDPHNHLLRKTVGFSALTKVLATIYPKIKTESPEGFKPAFRSFFEKAKANLGNEPFSPDKYGSSEGDATRMARAILKASEWGDN